VAVPIFIEERKAASGFITVEVEMAEEGEIFDGDENDIDPADGGDQPMEDLKIKP
jgi:hypothetical protein